jgi:hypothetical protein
MKTTKTKIKNRRNEKMTDDKEKVIHYIVYVMFINNISLEELVRTIKEKELDIIEMVNKRIEKRLTEHKPMDV